MSFVLSHPSLAECRRLFLRNYEVQMKIGAYESEKAGTQRVIFNIDLFVTLAASTSVADKLTEVVDYNLMRNTIGQRVAAGHVHLQETLCDDIAQAMLDHPSVRAVRVSTEKPDAYPDCESVGVEVFRIKAA
ncbi:dihydroneopterin aldolase [Pararobbsia silviterrae]|uniref:dihydroneopterin aldolase n=1 Tax=Pararobbsia silviterrae TaxID=1792498 RepID=A0A494Y957_9BURK|nr:dihydroneopterin aldolase [Pararobbsia silviterrae]RKP58655.1 dihydroneopterin aldolase [Pararobbsia silviterrae]